MEFFLEMLVNAIQIFTFFIFTASVFKNFGTNFSAVCLQNTFMDLASYPFKIQKC